MQTLQTSKTKRGVRCATLGDYRLVVYPEGGDCEQVRIPLQSAASISWQWVLADPEDFPRSLRRKLYRAIRHL